MKKIVFLLLTLFLFSFDYSYSVNLKKSTTSKTKTSEQEVNEVKQKLEEVKKFKNDCKLGCENICNKITHFKTDCKNACSFACEPIVICPFLYANEIKKCDSISHDLVINMGLCLLEKSIAYCSNLCRSYLNCKLECFYYYKSETKFCDRVCNFDPTLKWIYLTFDNLRNAIFFYIEDINQNIAKVWLRTIYTEKGKQEFIKNIDKLNVRGYEELDQSLDLLKIDCFKKKYQILNTIVYASDGSILDKAGVSEISAKWNSIPPDSLVGKLFEEICETKKYKSN